MHTFFKKLLASLLILTMTGCTTMREVTTDAPVPDSGKAVRADAVAVGDFLKIIKKDGGVVNLAVVSLTPTEIIGEQTGSSTKVGVPLNQIDKIERREFDGARTGGLVAGGLTVATALAALGIAAIAAGLRAGLSRNK